MRPELATKQVSVFLENKAGRLADVCKLLGAHGINLRAFSTADTGQFGILRMIASDPGRATEVLEASGHAVRESIVLVVRIEDKPGELARALCLLADEGINVEYLYGLVACFEGRALVVMRVLDEVLEQSAALLRNNGFSIMPAEQVYTL
jgi:hypothetical protein